RQKRAVLFTDMAAYREQHSTFLTDGDAERVDAAMVSPNLLDLLGAKPELGRTFGSGVEMDGDGHVAVLSHTLWQNRFHADPDIVGPLDRVGRPALQRDWRHASRL